MLCGRRAHVRRAEGSSGFARIAILVLTGSFNFTRAAEEHNAENLLVINDPVLARKYIENWHAHEQHSGPFERADKPLERTGRSKRD